MSENSAKKSEHVPIVRGEDREPTAARQNVARGGVWNVHESMLRMGFDHQQLAGIAMQQSLQVATQPELVADDTAQSQPYAESMPTDANLDIYNAEVTSDDSYFDGLATEVSAGQ